MKKIVILFAVLALVVTAFAGCGNSDVETSDTDVMETAGTEADETEETEETKAEDPTDDIYKSRTGVYREKDYPDMPGTDGLIYMLSPEKDAYYVKGYEGTDTDVYIPATHEGLPVTCIYSWSEGDCLIMTYGAFMGNKNITSVFIGKNVETISGYAFEGCSNLKSVVIPDSVRWVDGFTDCVNLSEIIISDKVENIYQYAFKNTAYYRDELNWEDGVLYIGNHAYSGENARGTVNVREGTKIISSNSFSNNDNITEIVLPKSLDIVCSNAFYNCAKLEKVSILGDLKCIDYLAFRKCTSLRDIDINGKIDSMSSGILDETAYYNDSENWENGILYLDEYLIDSNNHIDAHVVVKEGTRLIADRAFDNNAIFSVRLPSSIEIVGERSLYGLKLFEVYNLSDLDIEGMIANGDITSNVKNVYTSLDVPTKFTQLGDYMTYCDEQNGYYIIVDYDGDDTEIVFPDNIKGHDYEILDFAFRYNDHITKITIPNGVSVIGEHAFSRCENLTDVVIDADCIIEAAAFSESPKLINVTLSDNIKYIERYAFYGTGIHDNYYKDPDSYEYKSLYIGNHLIACPEYYSDDIYTIRDGTKTISAPMSFYWSTTPTQIILPNELVSISGEIFSDNNKLEQLIIPDSVEYIGGGAFQLSALKNIRIPDKVKSIEQLLFRGCKNLEYIIIGSSVEQIKEYAFLNADALTDVYYNGTEEMWGNINIDDHGNVDLLEATVYFYSETEPTTAGNFWHYVDGVPTKWQAIK